MSPEVGTDKSTTPGRPLAGTRKRTRSENRARGTGTLRERPPGSKRWELRVYLGKDPVTGKPRQVTRTFHGRASRAKVALQQFAVEVTKPDGDEGPGTSVTLATLFAEWRRFRAPAFSPKTLREYDAVIEKLILPAIGNLAVGRLTAHDLDAFYAGLPTPWRARHCHDVISSALSQAVKWGWVGSNIARSATPPAKPRKELRPPSPAEVTLLVQEAEKKEPAMAVLLALAAVTGCRRGELCALQWGDIDWERGVLTIARSAVELKGEVVVKGTKTGRSRRIALGPLSEAVLQRRKVDAGAMAADTEIPLTNAHCVFSRWPDGRALPPSQVNNFWSKIRSDVGLPHVRLHDLRHLSVSVLVGAGVDVRTVAERHGHAQATMTLDRYAHAMPQRDREAAGLIEGVMGELGTVLEL